MLNHYWFSTFFITCADNLCQINKYSHIYVFNEEHGSYLLEDETKVSQRLNFYLNENLTDISSLDKNIKTISSL